MARKLLLAAAVLFLFLGARQRSVRQPAAPAGPTFSNEVVRIFQTHCQSCHREGDIAPFSLTTYGEAAPWAHAIKFMTATRQMPPWKPAAGCGDFADARGLSVEEIATIGRWVDAGAPEGDRSQLPAPLNFDGGWSLGEPDLVVTYPEPYTAPSSGDMYRCFTIPTNQDAERYVAGLRLPANSRVVLQVHYHSHDGRPQPDRTELAMYFSERQPKQLLRIIPVLNQNFEIPPGESNHRVTAGIPIVPFAVHLWVIAPHMHLLGRSMKVEMTAPGGQTQCLINIDDWDFNWQAMYRYRNPVAVPAWSSVSLTASYDNSSSNPRNPNNPPRPVRWGEATTDEMCIAFLGVTIDGENLAKGIADDSALRPR